MFPISSYSIFIIILTIALIITVFIIFYFYNKLNNQVWTIIDLKEKQMHELNSKDLQLKEKKLMLSEKVHIIEDLTLKFNNIKKELSNKKRELTRISNLYETVRESLHKYSKITEYSADNKIEEIYQKIMQKDRKLQKRVRDL